MAQTHDLKLSLLSLLFDHSNIALHLPHLNISTSSKGIEGEGAVALQGKDKAER